MPNLPSGPTTPGDPNKPSDEVTKYLEELKARLPASHPAQSALIAPGTGGAYGARGRLIFALDATASRQPTWDSACHLQNEMFTATAALGGLDTQLVFFRGLDNCKTSRWLTTASEVHRVMSGVSCIGGLTQIERVLDHAIGETKRAKVAALVFVGDAMEEKVDRLCQRAGELGRLDVPIFVFHEGHDPNAEAAFRQIATLSKGAYLAFDLASIGRLKELLGAIAIFATGNRAALEAYGAKKGGEVLRLTSQLHLTAPTKRG
jgi:hypothetical protein